MATKKETAAAEALQKEPETAAPEETTVPVLPEGTDIETLKAMAKVMAKEMVEEERANLIKTQAELENEKEAARIAYLEEKVPYTVPYVENEPEDITVRVGNRPTLQIMKGEEVMIPRYAVEVLKRREKMRARARKYEREHNRTDDK